MTVKVNLNMPASWTDRDRQVAQVAAAATADKVYLAAFEEGAAGMIQRLARDGKLAAGPDGSEVVREVVRDVEGRISEVIERKVRVRKAKD